MDIKSVTAPSQEICESLTHHAWGPYAQLQACEDSFPDVFVVNRLGPARAHLYKLDYTWGFVFKNFFRLDTQI